MTRSRRGRAPSAIEEIRFGGLTIYLAPAALFRQKQTELLGHVLYNGHIVVIFNNRRAVGITTPLYPSSDVDDALEFVRSRYL